jgi:DHA1 family inner membrane transport protein
MTVTDQRSERLALWVLMLGNFIIGTGVLLPAGLLTDLMADFDISAARAGLVIFVGGLVVGVGAPLFAWATSATDRRSLLAASLAIYVVGHAASAVMPDFMPMVMVRALTVVGAAIFTPQAAATVGLLVGAERRAAAIAFIFLGWSAASVAGIPLGSLLGEAIGWRATFLVMAGLAAVGTGAVWLTLPAGLKVQPLLLASWGRVFASPALMLVLAVTFASMAGQFTLFSYIAPVLKTAYGASAALIALTFAIVGTMGVIGNYGAARVAAIFGVERSILVSLVGMAAGFVIIAATFGSYAAFLAGGLLWGLGTFASNSLQQSRLVMLAPALASATVALNTSVVYLGQSIGSTAGGAIIAGGASPGLAWVGAVFLAAAAALSLAAARMAPPAG